jgi:ATP-dependent Clp protease ATP-binding subunit ClpC
VEDPLSEEILRGSFKGKDMIKITVKGEDAASKHLYFEALTTPPSGDDPQKQQLAQASSDAT